MTKKDIVARLRECDQGLLEECQEPELGDIVTDCSSIAEAANLIEQLREERAYLREERDYARRWVCEVLANPSLITGLDKPGDGTKRAFAKEQGWDCFYEDNHNA